MKRNLLAFVTASALALSVAAPSAQAMEMEFNMLTGAVFNALVQMNLPTDNIHDLTLSEIAQIKDLLDEDSEGKRSRIKVILDRK